MHDVIRVLLIGECIKCYQCSSDEDKKNDYCGAYESFDTLKNTQVDCLSNEADVPGTFCYKSIQQGPRGFIWDGRWRTVERRCAQVSDRGISWGCDWGYDENGVYWEKCYCAEDGCNRSIEPRGLNLVLGISTVLLSILCLVNKC